MKTPRSADAGRRRIIGKARLRLQNFADSRQLPLGDAKAACEQRAAFARARIQAPLASALQAQAAAPAAQAAQSVWRWLGPSEITKGQTYGSSRVVVSGRISAVAVDPSDVNHILIGAAAGGVWQSRDGGKSWSPHTDGATSLSVGALAFDPTNPKRAYCRTGEGDSYSALGTGVLISDDAGQTWTASPDQSFCGAGFFRMLVDPAASMHLMGATTLGLFESGDKGVSWTKARDGDTRCWSFSFGTPHNAMRELLAASADGLWRRREGDTDWSQVYLPGLQPAVARLVVAHAPSNGGIAYVFGACDPQVPIPDDDSGGTMPTPLLWRRAAGGSFQAIALPPELSTTQAWYDWHFSVAPDNPNRIYLGAVDLYRGEWDGADWCWINLSTKEVGDSIHPDQHALAFAPNDPRVIYAACDGGLFRSTDMGEHWTSLNAGLGITEVEYFAQDAAKAEWLLAGTQDNGTIRYTGSGSWEHVADGDGGFCFVNEKSPDTVFHTFYNMSLERSIKSSNWVDISPRVAWDYACAFYPPMTGSETTVAMAGDSVFVSRENGPPWTEIPLPRVDKHYATALYLPSPDRIFIGMSDGRIFVTHWAGAAWSFPADALPPIADLWITDLMVDNGAPEHIWTTGNDSAQRGHVLLYDPASQQWRDKTPATLNLPINAIEIDLANPKRLWIAADVGVWQTLDQGANWAPLGASLPNALVEEVLYNPAGKMLRAGTRSRGVWEIAV